MFFCHLKRFNPRTECYCRTRGSFQKELYCIVSTLVGIRFQFLDFFFQLDACLGKMLHQLEKLLLTWHCFDRFNRTHTFFATFIKEVTHWNMIFKEVLKLISFTAIGANKSCDCRCFHTVHGYSPLSHILWEMNQFYQSTHKIHALSKTCLQNVSVRNGR